MRNTLAELGLRWGRPKLDLIHRQDPAEVARAKRLRNGALKKTILSRGRWAFLYLDEAEFHLNPGLCQCWSPPGERVIVPSAGQNRRVPVFGALDAVSGEVTALLTAKKCGADFLDFLKFLSGKHYAEQERVYLFLDNCSIHHTRAVREFLQSQRPRVRVIWNAAYAPNLNLIERFWGHLKRSAIHNDYFQTVENLEDAILRAIHSINRQLDHPFRLQLKTVQPLLAAA